MCYFDKYTFSCGDWKWGHFRQHCIREYRVGETCGLKLIMQDVVVNHECKLCEKGETRERILAKELDRTLGWEMPAVPHVLKLRSKYTPRMLDEMDNAFLERRLSSHKTSGTHREVATTSSSSQVREKESRRPKKLSPNHSFAYTQKGKNLASSVTDPADSQDRDRACEIQLFSYSNTHMMQNLVTTSAERERAYMKNLQFCISNPYGIGLGNGIGRESGDSGTALAEAAVGSRKGSSRRRDKRGSKRSKRG